MDRTPADVVHACVSFNPSASLKQSLRSLTYNAANGWSESSENFTEENEIHPVATENSLVSAAGSGCVPFVDAADVAAVAAKALTRHESYNTNLLILGPEVMGYDDVRYNQTCLLAFARPLSEFLSYSRRQFK